MTSTDRRQFLTTAAAVAAATPFAGGPLPLRGGTGRHPQLGFGGLWRTRQRLDW